MDRIVKFCFLSLAMAVFFAMGCGTSTLNIVTENYKPYNYEQSGEVKGTATEIVKKVLRHSGVKYKIAVDDWTTVYNAAQRQKNILIYSMVRTPQRENLFKWVAPVAKPDYTAFYALRKNRYSWVRTVEKAKRLKIAAVGNWSGHQWLEKNNFPKIKVYDDLDSAIRGLFRGKADMIALSAASSAKSIRNAGFNPRRVVKVMNVYELQLYMALSPSTSDSVLEKLQNSYEELMRKGEIKLPR